jgi:hypothetical protein
MAEVADQTQLPLNGIAQHLVFLQLLEFDAAYKLRHTG